MNKIIFSLMNKIIFLSLFMTCVFAQVSLSDLNKLNNKQIEAIRSELQSNPQIVPNDIDKNLIDEANSSIQEAVEINPEISSTENENFGYDYFKRSINFFDNIPTPSNYKLGPGDEIIISLWGETNLSDIFTINKQGLVYYENIGFINLSNKTVDEAEQLLVSKLSQIYSTLVDKDNPTKLMLEIRKLKSVNIYFSGQVEQPGIHLIHSFSDIFTALVQAGGVKQEGSLRNIQLVRKGEIIASVDFYSFFSNGLNNFYDLRLIDGDTIHVPAIENRVEIQGSVLRPGFYEVIASDKLNDLINYAAGLKAKASSVVTVDTVIPIAQRISQDNIISSINIDLNLSQEHQLNNGDLITVREIGASDSKVEVFGKVKVPGQYSALNMSLKNILDIAGGFDDPVFRKTIREDNIIVLRKDEKQFYSLEYNIDYKDSDSFMLKIDDKIFVYEDINFRNSYTYRVEGEVNKPGTYPFKKGVTLNEALRLAEGLTDLTTEDNIVISQEFTEIDEDGNLKTISKKVANAKLDFQLDPNIVITALPFENVVSVEGNVYNPGLVSYEKGMNMSKAIILAGGYKPYSLKKRAYVKRANGEIDKANTFRGRLKRVYPGDTVVVPQDPNPSDFDITTFVSDMTTVLANIVAILIIAENQND